MSTYFTVSISLPKDLGGGCIFESRMLKTAADARTEADSIAKSNKAIHARACVYHLQEHIGAAHVIATPYNPYKK